MLFAGIIATTAGVRSLDAVASQLKTLTAEIHALNTEQVDTQLSRAFAEADKDRDGLLSFTEFSKSYSKSYPRAMERNVLTAELKAALNILDNDADRVEAFLTAWKAAYAKADPPLKEQMIAMVVLAFPTAQGINVRAALTSAGLL